MKKKKKNGNNFIKRFSLFIITGFFMIVFVFLYIKIVYIGRQIEKLKEKYEFLNLLNKNYYLQLIKLTNYENLIKIAKEKNINLVVPKNWCFLEIIDVKNEKDFKKTRIVQAKTR